MKRRGGDPCNVAWDEESSSTDDDQEDGVFGSQPFSNGNRVSRRQRGRENAKSRGAAWYAQRRGRHRAVAYGDNSLELSSSDDDFPIGTL